MRTLVRPVLRHLSHHLLWVFTGSHTFSHSRVRGFLFTRQQAYLGVLCPAWTGSDLTSPLSASFPLFLPGRSSLILSAHWNASCKASLTRLTLPSRCPSWPSYPFSAECLQDTPSRVVCLDRHTRGDFVRRPTQIFEVTSPTMTCFSSCIITSL